MYFVIYFLQTTLSQQVNC